MTKNDFVKKILFFATFCAVFVPVSAQNSVMVQDPAVFDVYESTEAPELDETVPLALEGIWENSSRYMIFDSGYVDRVSRLVVPTAALKLFYGWYLDRAAESDEYTQSHPRDRNDATTSSAAQQLQIHFVPLTYELFPQESGAGAVYNQDTMLYANGEVSGAWDMQVKYPGIREIYHIPVCVIGNKLYLKFKIRNEIPSSEQDDMLFGFWLDQGYASGITISPPYMNSELLCYFITENDCFHIRYWETDMEYDSETQAEFSVQNQLYSVPKHLISAGRVFTCVNGRSRKIRNIERTDSIPEDYTLNSVKVIATSYDDFGNAYTEEYNTATLCALGDPYLVLVEGSRTYEEILTESAKRVRPAPAPLFPPHGILDFDWSIVEDPPSSFNRRMLDLGK